MRIGVPDLISNSYFPAIAAVELGFLKAEGLDAELRHVFPLPKTMEALRDNELDFVAGSAHATLSAFPRWKGAKLLATLAQKTYWLLILRADLGAEKGDVQAIKGLRIGAAPGPDMALRGLLAEAGIDPERDHVEIGAVPGAGGPGVSFGVHAARLLKEGTIDGFWANAMGNEIAVRSGAGSVVLDVRRGIGPPASQDFTFAALVTTDDLIARDPNGAAAAVRAIVRTQKALRGNPTLATEVGNRVFPEAEAGLIAGLVERDLPYYDSSITENAVARMNQFAQSIGLLSGPIFGAPPYEAVVATQFRHLW
ncbi:MAG: nitrate ABC transporter substrate-binding protein [SAR202 cluster bacterium Io17-Chloro-G7]|nr:MAG: nitrate ABC transporter substrate-binding protein [SAR202 cluster bacterium Io17-Chloro-G7]